MKYLSPNQVRQEFDRQLDNLLRIGYSGLAGISDREFQKQVLPLQQQAENLTVAEPDLQQGILPFVIVIKSEMVLAEKSMGLVRRNDRQGVTILRPHTPDNFHAIGEVSLPAGWAYLLVDIDRGRNTLNTTPKEAMGIIRSEGRTPLTIDEGIAIVTQFPEFLMKNNCFSLLASRTGTDKRVPAIWINAKKEPNLGWCWEGNPHTWLGSASAKYRMGTETG